MKIDKRKYKQYIREEYCFDINVYKDSGRKQNVATEESEEET